MGRAGSPASIHETFNSTVEVVGCIIRDGRALWLGDQARLPDPAHASASSGADVRARARSQNVRTCINTRAQQRGPHARVRVRKHLRVSLQMAAPMASSSDAA